MHPTPAGDDSDAREHGGDFPYKACPCPATSAERSPPPMPDSESYLLEPNQRLVAVVTLVRDHLARQSTGSVAPGPSRLRELVRWLTTGMLAAPGDRGPGHARSRFPGAGRGRAIYRAAAWIARPIGPDPDTVTMSSSIARVMATYAIFRR